MQYDVQTSQQIDFCLLFALASVLVHCGVDGMML